MTGFLINYFVFYAFLFIASEKLHLQEKLSQSKFKILYSLSKCDFCFCFWVACFSTVVSSLFMSNDPLRILHPFAIVGLWLILKEFRNE